MKPSETKEYEVKGIKVKCHVCSGLRFWERNTLMNTAGATFFGFDWANKEALNLICEHCGYIMWFWHQED